MRPKEFAQHEFLSLLVIIRGSNLMNRIAKLLETSTLKIGMCSGTGLGAVYLATIALVAILSF